MDNSVQAGINRFTGKHYPFYREGHVLNDRKRFYKNVWSSMGMFINQTKNRNDDLNLGATRFVVSFY